LSKKDQRKKKKGKAKQNKTKQNKTKQNKNKTKQNKTKQNKTKQNKTKQQNKNKNKNKTKQKQKQKKKQEKIIVLPRSLSCLCFLPTMYVTYLPYPITSSVIKTLTQQQTEQPLHKNYSATLIPLLSYPHWN